MLTRVSIYRTRPRSADAHDESALRCHGVLAAQPGFLGRLLGRNAEDPAERVEALLWESPEHARAAFSAASVDSTVRAWLEHVDLPTVTTYAMTTNGMIGRAERALSDGSVGSWLLVRWRTLDGVDAARHTRTELLMHHEAFAPAAGYLGAHVLQESNGPERMELIAWPTFDIAKASVGAILGAGHPLVGSHMADCAPGASLHYLEPVLRA
jgi:hypothetical protein